MFVTGAALFFRNDDKLLPPFQQGQQKVNTPQDAAQPAPAHSHTSRAGTGQRGYDVAPRTSATTWAPHAGDPRRPHRLPLCPNHVVSRRSPLARSAVRRRSVPVPARPSPTPCANLLCWCGELGRIPVRWLRVFRCVSYPRLLSSPECRRSTNKSPPSKANFSRTMKRMKKAVLNKAEGRTAHKFQFELKLTNVGALDRVLKGLDGSTLFVQERPSA